jgi:ABC-type multidrug transport system fused ATPase/permease subunit
MLDSTLDTLDRITCQQVLGAIKSNLKEVTLIVISKYVSIMKEMDLIVGLEDGEVVEEGTPVELANKPYSRFSQMMQVQGEYLV